MPALVSLPESSFPIRSCCLVLNGVSVVMVQSRVVLYPGGVGVSPERDLGLEIRLMMKDVGELRVLAP